MAIARLSGQDAKNASVGTSVSVAYPGATTSGNTLIATVYANVAVGLGSISGWTSIVTGPISNSLQEVTIWAKISDGTETTITASGYTGANVMKLHIYEYSGLNASLTTDGTNTATSTLSSVTSLLSGSITTTNANDLLFIAGATNAAITAPSYDSSFNLRQVDPSTGNIRLFDGDQIVSATGTYSSTGSWTTAARAGNAIAAFKAPATNTSHNLSLLGVGS